MPQLLNVRVPYNAACDPAPAPGGSAPLGWTSLMLETGPSRPGFVYEIWAVEFFALRSARPAPGCELFYEFEMNFDAPTGPISANVLFSDSEDVSPQNADIATFRMRTMQVERSLPPTVPGPYGISIAILDLPLSPGRSAAREGIRKWPEVQWRVRVWTGAGGSSQWSTYRRHAQGPALTP